MDAKSHPDKTIGCDCSFMLTFNDCLVKLLFELRHGLVNISHINNCLRLVILLFQNNENTGHMYVITFIFNGCHHNWAADTPDKYEHDWKYLTYTFAKSKFLVTEKLTNWALVTPTPGRTDDDDSDSSVGQVSGYGSDSDSEADSIKDVGNVIAPSTWCTRSSRND